MFAINFNQQIKLYYVTHFARFLSTDADAICVTKTCEALSKAGLEIELIVPNRDIPQKDVIEEEIFRLRLIEAFRKTIKNSLWLLGIDVMEEM